MFGRIILIVVVVGAIAAGVWGKQFLSIGTAPPDNDPAANAPEEPPQPVQIGDALYKVASPQVPAPAKQQGRALNPIVMHDCQITAPEKVELPCTREGQILFIGTPLKEGEEKTLPAKDILDAEFAGKKVKIRRLKEDDIVEKDQLLAVIDDRIALAEYAARQQNVKVAISEAAAADATYKEASKQLETGRMLHGQSVRAMSPEELSTRGATKEKFYQEYLSKREVIDKARREEDQARTVLVLHEVRSPIRGRIETIYHQPKEAVKSSPNPEPLFRIVNDLKLRVEGLVDEHFYRRLQTGSKVVVERSLSQTPIKTCVGHLQEVTGVAVATNGPKTRIVSSSLDGTVRVWEGESQGEVLRWDHPHGVKVQCVACSPKGAKENLCLSGSSDGIARLWDLNENSDKPKRVLDSKHRGLIHCVAFTPDGKFCATAGDDREILIHDTATGALKYKLTGHQGAVTSLQFMPDSQLLSAGRDHMLRLWKLGTEAGREEARIGGRSGDVTQLGVSPDGKYVLYDPKPAKTLRVMSIPKWSHDGVIQAPPGGNQFSALALFSPDAQLILSSSGADGRLQLWNSPLATGRASVVRQLMTEDRAQPTCGAFSPTGEFLVTGTRDKNVYIWEIPARQETARQLTAVVTRVEPTLDPSSHQVRVWAEVENPPKDLVPGANVTMVQFQQ